MKKYKVIVEEISESLTIPYDDKTKNKYYIVNDKVSFSMNIYHDKVEYVVEAKSEKFLNNFNNVLSCDIIDEYEKLFEKVVPDDWFSIKYRKVLNSTFFKTEDRACSSEVQKRYKIDPSSINRIIYCEF